MIANAQLPFARGTKLSSATGTVDPQNPLVARGPKQFGTREDFLLLLIEQIKAQDPMDPMDSNEFTAQLVGYTQLEEIISLNEGMSALRKSQDLVGASQLIGKYIEGLDANGSIIAGTVSSVEMIEGEATLVVGDALLLLSQVYTVRDTEKEG